MKMPERFRQEGALYRHTELILYLRQPVGPILALSGEPFGGADGAIRAFILKVYHSKSVKCANSEGQNSRK